MAVTQRQLHKFGGSSLANAECYHRVAHIIQTQGTLGDLVVVSAAGRTTNALLALVTQAQQGEDWQTSLASLLEFQQQLIDSTLGLQGTELLAQLSVDAVQIDGLLSEAQIACADIQAYGELWSARLLAALLQQQGATALPVDSRRFLRLEGEVQPQADWSASSEQLHQILAAHPESRLVITGYFGADVEGNTRLLGRNGSDYSATLIGALAEVSEVNIWTDVAGIYNADPNLLADARLQTKLSLAEADQLAKLGSPVLHSRTLQPLSQLPMALNVRSSYTPNSEYTQILASGCEQTEPVVTSLRQVALHSWSGEHSAIAHLEAWLAQQGITPLAVYPQLVSLALTCEQSRQLGETLDQQAQQLGLTQGRCDERYGLVGLVSQHADRIQGAFSRLLSRSALSCYRHPCALVTLVPVAQVTALVESVHRRLAGPRKRIGVVLAGKGNIGEAWLELFAKQQQALNQELEAELRLVAILGSRQYWLAPEGIDARRWQTGFAQQAQDYQGLEWLAPVQALDLDELVLLDITASASLGLNYPEVVAAGLHVVSANKQAGSGPQHFFNELQHQLEHCHRYWRYNASVGAGLPVFYSIDDLGRSGDEISSVSGVFSGTLSWLFAHYDQGQPFSELVVNAKAEGLTEPDPRDDLSGRDMQRKLLILARELGVSLELDQIELESLVPEALAQLPLDQFMARIGELDSPMAQATAKAKSEGKVLRYAASLHIEGGDIKARVGLVNVSATHPFATLPAGDNQFLFVSEHYPNGLVIQGPGAGRAVTAAAVQSDFVAICRRLLH